MSLQNVSIRTKLIGAFSLLVLLLVGLGFLGLRGLQQINTQTAEIADNWLVGVRAVGNLNNEVAEYRTALLRHVLASGDNLSAAEEEIT